MPGFLWLISLHCMLSLSFRHTKITMTDIKGKDYDRKKTHSNNVNISEELVLIMEELKQNTRWS